MIFIIIFTIPVFWSFFVFLFCFVSFFPLCPPCFGFGRRRRRLLSRINSLPPRSLPSCSVSMTTLRGRPPPATPLACTAAVCPGPAGPGLPRPRAARPSPVCMAPPLHPGSASAPTSQGLHFLKDPSSQLPLGPRKPAWRRGRQGDLARLVEPHPHPAKPRCLHSHLCRWHASPPLPKMEPARRATSARASRWEAHRARPVSRVPWDNIKPPRTTARAGM